MSTFIGLKINKKETKKVLTVKEIKEILAKKEIKFDENAKKEDLLALLAKEE